MMATDATVIVGAASVLLVVVIVIKLLLLLLVELLLLLSGRRRQHGGRRRRVMQLLLAAVQLVAAADEQCGRRLDVRPLHHDQHTRTPNPLNTRCKACGPFGRASTYTEASARDSRSSGHYTVASTPSRMVCANCIEVLRCPWVVQVKVGVSEVT